MNMLFKNQIISFKHIYMRNKKVGNSLSMQREYQDLKNNIQLKGQRWKLTVFQYLISIYLDFNFFYVRLAHFST
jgi:hypothetical protein